jgi:hypothetical protein
MRSKGSGLSGDTEREVFIHRRSPGRAGPMRTASLLWNEKFGQRAVKSAFLRRCLQHVEEQRRLQALTIRGSSTRTSKSK